MLKLSKCLETTNKGSNKDLLTSQEDLLKISPLFFYDKYHTLSI